MSLYRQAGGSSRRLVLAVALVALLVGGASGYLLGRGSAPEPTLGELVADARAELRPALSALELVGIEYPEAVGPSGDVVAETELEAAKSQAASAADALDRADGLEAIDPQGLEEAAARVARLLAAVERETRPAVVKSLNAEAAEAVSRLVEPPQGP